MCIETMSIHRNGEFRCRGSVVHPLYLLSKGERSDKVGGDAIGVWWLMWVLPTIPKGEIVGSLEYMVVIVGNILRSWWCYKGCTVYVDSVLDAYRIYGTELTGFGCELIGFDPIPNRSTPTCYVQRHIYIYVFRCVGVSRHMW